MNISISQSAQLTPDAITSHIYEDPGSGAYLEFGTGLTVGQSIMIWVGRGNADPGEEAQALRKLARLTSELGDWLDGQAGTS